MAQYAPVFLIYACIGKSCTFRQHRLKRKGAFGSCKEWLPPRSQKCHFCCIMICRNIFTDHDSRKNPTPLLLY